MTDLERLAQLERLLEAANQAVSKSSKSEDYVQYCYRTMSKYFWEVVSQMETLPKGDNLYWTGKGYKQNMENYLTVARTHIEGGWVNEALRDVGVLASDTTKLTDLELLRQLEGLVFAADNEVYIWNHRYIERTVEEQEQYSRWVFSTIQKQFWDIARKVKNQPTYQLETSYEGKMKSYLYAMNANREGSWYTNTLKKLGLKG